LEKNMEKESYPFHHTKMTLDDLCLKLVNENKFSDIFRKLSIYVVDYYSGYLEGDDESELTQGDEIHELESFLKHSIQIIKKAESDSYLDSFLHKD
tara:strand:- start:138 stop:425 length:288 start_codon:yes stop_codon:yes gene_type:complete